MQWEIINTPKQPKCIFCDKTTSQMLVCHRYISLDNIHICSYCARFVKDAMNKWEVLKNMDYIEQSGIFNDKLTDKQIDHVLFPEVDPDDEMKQQAIVEPWSDQQPDKKPNTSDKIKNMFKNLD